MLKGLCIDNHIAVAADLRNMWAGRATLRHVCLSGHAPYLGVVSGRVDMLQGDNWCTSIQERRAGEFYATYHTLIDEFDFIVTTMPPIWAMLYRDFDKPIITVLPVRYEYGATGNPELWAEWNEFIRERTARGMMCVAANNAYDALYYNHYSGMTCDVIPSVCDYTGCTYNPVRGRSLYYASWNAIPENKRVLRKHAVLAAGHSWQTIADYNSLVHIPYNVSTMSMYEHRSTGMPIYAPTKRLMRQWRAEGKPVLNQVSWNEACNMTPGSVLPNISGLDLNVYDNADVFDTWLDNCDLYNGVVPTYAEFDSPAELIDMCEHEDTDALYEHSKVVRMAHGDTRDLAFLKWDIILDKVEGVLK